MRTFGALGNRNFRLYFLSQLISQCGNNMQVVGVAWLVLRAGGDGVALGGAIALQYGPLLLLGPFGGSLADRFERRRYLCVTQGALGLAAVCFAVLCQAGSANLTAVNVLVVVSGVIGALDLPGRQALLGDLVPPAQLNNAISLNSVIVNVARIIGPAIGGLLLGVGGVALLFWLNAVSFGVVMLCLVLMRPLTEAARHAGAPRATVRAGVRYVWNTRDLRVPLVMVGLLGMFAWEFQVTLPLLAAHFGGGEAQAYAFMLTALGAGAVCGGVYSAWRGSATARGLVAATVFWAATLVGVALAPGYRTALLAVVFAGAGAVVFSAQSKTILQRDSTPDMRGRVMALWVIAWQGTTLVGAPIVGFVAQAWGPRWPFVLAGVAAAGAALLALPWGSTAQLPELNEG
ncbi:MFS transporter [Dactylosporangium sp. CS-033363]|uniref:MFS transporter n=1 Tax=Dactylosporangium sp. CS-033363 TaxID=3239935 RepID=UPI003D94A08C